MLFVLSIIGIVESSSLASGRRPDHSRETGPESKPLAAVPGAWHLGPTVQRSQTDLTSHSDQSTQPAQFRDLHFGTTTGLLVRMLRETMFVEAMHFYSACIFGNSDTIEQAIQTAVV